MKIWENKYYRKISMLLIREKERQNKDLWNCESKSNVNRIWWLVNLYVQSKLYVLHFFKQLIAFNNDCCSLIDKGIFYQATFSFKMFILFSVYKNLFGNCNSFALPQKCWNFLWHFDGNSPVIICSYLFSKQKLCGFVSVVPFQLVEIASWFSFLMRRLNACVVKFFYGSILVSSLC